MSKAGEISRVNEAPIVQLLDCGLFVVSPFQPRLDPKNANIPEIGAAIREDGVQKPILARPIYKTPGDKTSEIVGYEIVDGERRWRGTMWAGIKWIPAIIRDMDDAEAKRLALVLNIQSIYLTDYEIALALKEQLSPSDGSEPISKQELCRLISKSQTYVDNHVKLLEVRKELQPLAQVPGKLSVTLLLDDIKNETIFDELHELAKEGAPFQIVKILSVVADDETRANIHYWWTKGAKLKKLEELRDKAIEAAKAQADMLNESTKAPDTETGQRAAENERSGGGNVSRGKQVKGSTSKEAYESVANIFEQMELSMNTVNKWLPYMTKAQRRKVTKRSQEVIEKIETTMVSEVAN